jgi:hypothetical protein
MKDNALHLEGFLPPAGKSILLSPLDLGVDLAAFSNQWRQGFLRFSWPALPNHTNPDLNITATLCDSGDGGLSFQTGCSGSAALIPMVLAAIPGVAGTGAAAGYMDFPVPPRIRGPVGLLITSPSTGGDNTGCLVNFDGYDE